jgi:release factor glutamine methyltransferase
MNEFARSSIPASETIQSVLQWGEDHLLDARFESPSLEARAILGGLLNEGPTGLYMKKREPVSTDVAERFKELVLRRLRHEPVAYLLGVKNFWGRDFIVNEHVLIPRPETEQLVQVAKDIFQIRNIQNQTILDLCTGSGCIGVTLALDFPAARVVASDVSEKALQVARENADRYYATRNLRFLKSDLFQSFPQTEFKGYFDMIVANPPYVLSKEINHLEPDLFFEPRLALDGGETGISVLDPLIRQAPRFLKTNGILLVEIGHNLGERVAGLFKETGFGAVVVVKDDAGHDRIVKGELNGSV